MMTKDCLRLLRPGIGVLVALMCSNTTTLANKRVGSRMEAFRTYDAPIDAMTGYWWVNMSDIVYSRGREPQGSVLVRYNLSTGIGTDLIGLTSLVIASGCACEEVVPSPDGKSVAWISKHGNKDLMIASIARQRLTSHFKFDREVRNPIWSADNKSCMCFGESLVPAGSIAKPVNPFLEALVFDEAFLVKVGAHTEVRKFPIPPKIGYIDNGQFVVTRGKVELHEFYQRTRLTAANKLLVSKERIGQLALSETVSLEILDVTQANAATVPYHVALPHGARLVDLQFSPAGGRIVWLLERDGVSELWLSSDDGLDLRPIHTFARERSVRARESNAQTSLRWAPSGDTVSVLLNSTFYLFHL